MTARTSLWALSLGLLLTGFARAQDSPLQSIAPDADVVIRLKEPDRTIEKVTDLVRAVQPQLADQVQQNAAALGLLISNPTQTGVDNTQNWYVAAFTRGEQEPQVVFVIPAIDAEQMKSALGEGMTTAVKGKYVFYTEAPGEIPLAESANASIAAKITGFAGELFQKGDLSVFVNVDHLTSVYRQQIDAGYDQVLQQLNNIRFQIPQEAAGGLNIGAMVDVYGQIIEMFYQALNDTSHLAVAINVSASGTTIEDYVAFHPDSATGRKWSNNATSSLALIEKLPDNAAVYYAMHGGLKELTKWGIDLNMTMLQDEAKKQQIEQVFAELDGVEFGSMAGSIALGSGGGGMVRAVSITEATPGEKVKSWTRKLLGIVGEMELPGVKQTVQIQQDAETHGHYKADVITIKQELTVDNPAAEMQKKMQDAIFGPDGMVTRNVYMSDKYLSSFGGGTDALQQALNRLDATSPNSLAGYRKNLISPANFHLLLDLPTLAGQGIKAAATIPDLPLPLDGSLVDNLNLQRSFIGFSLAAQSHGIHCKTDVPVEQVQGIMKIVMAVGMAMQAR